MRLLFIFLLLALIPVSLAITSPPIFCTSASKLNSTMYSCLQNGQDALFYQSGFCTVVTCSPKSPSLPALCMHGTAFADGIQNCLNMNFISDVYGNASCAAVKCIQKTVRGTTTNVTNSTGGIIGALEAYGSQYANILGTIAGGAATAGAAIIGWYLTRKKKTKMGQYLTSIDDTYATLKMNEKECEAQLHKLKHAITEDLKKGNIEESTYEILENRINGYLDEIREREKIEKEKLKEAKKEE